METYTQLPKSIRGVAGLGLLYSRHRRRVGKLLPGLIAETQKTAQTIENILGVPFRDLAVLDVGPGQFLIQSYILGVDNSVTAIDLEVIAEGLSPVTYFRMLRTNGSIRTLKTLARKTLGIDREYRRQLELSLGVRPLPKVKIIQGDVTASGLQEGQFHVVHCRALFEHVSDPEAGIRELSRVLSPGGVLFISIHLYTSFNGSLDPRVAEGVGDESLHWAHLRPSIRDTIRGEGGLNKLRLGTWEELFNRVCPGYVRDVENSSRAGIPEVANRYILSGELPGYTKEELCAHTLRVFWKKPGSLKTSQLSPA